MTSCECGGERFAVIENYNTCLGCGTCLEYAPVMTFSYNHPYAKRPRAYYCRVKRFRQYIIDQKEEILCQNLNPILDVYNYVEFFWALSKGNRRYFFSRKVILFFIVQILELGVKTPLLKDKERTNEQIESIKKLMTVGRKQGILV